MNFSKEFLETSRISFDQPLNANQTSNYSYSIDCSGLHDGLSAAQHGLPLDRSPPPFSRDTHHRHLCLDVYGCANYIYRLSNHLSPNFSTRNPRNSGNFSKRFFSSPFSANPSSPALIFSSSLFNLGSSRTLELPCEQETKISKVRVFRLKLRLYFWLLQERPFSLKLLVAPVEFQC